MINKDKLDKIYDIINQYNQIKAENTQINKKIVSFHQILDEKIDVCDRTEQILESATKEFNGLTSIFNRKDMAFFVFALILFGAYKAVIKIMRDIKDSDLAKKTPFHKEEHSARSNISYYCSRAEIVMNPVPFDAIQKTQGVDWFSTHREGGIPGFNGFNHRTKALGHDPILGLIFGTANIMTSTITRNDFCSWHVVTHGHERTFKSGIKTISLDSISEPASTYRIFSSIFERLESEGKEGWHTLGCALLKEIVHLLSDINSRQSLPLPFISAFSEQTARKLSLYGLNFGTIAQGGMAAMAINWLIGFLHGLCRTPKEDEKLYEVRTRKIIMYANSFATFSDLAYTIFLAYVGDKNALRKFDLGGTIVTCYQICHSVAVIREIEAEFYMSKIYESMNLKR